ncbi:type II toxin-antitoxin system CcdA family antitoxin [Sphingomonadaceae bacterium OTU29THOMA1]|uniref:type II toxin-antitoxin system CcdA family antitoxin n=1 Tax=Sphingomonas sp. Leaf37 TaxID=2876552 RepID=UPI001E4723BB|nr:type II toxin-antitoxin system CcdA family antitoxin [Sphingomonas sp. Leaf37]USU10969.1 type II toxin-antitoxin system CcdA family antitoxin [Sphingomonadaceae bacterium OTU29THOMA1]
MKHDPIASGKRKPVNVSLDTGIVAVAREHGLNLSQISEAAIRQAAKVEMERRWREENKDAIEGWNRWYEKNGHPLDAYRLF